MPAIWEPLTEPVNQTKSFLLTFGNTPVGMELHSMEPPSIQPVSEPKYIHGFRHKQILIDNRYPACVYEHSFQVITEAGTVVGRLEEFFAYNWMFQLTSGSPTLPRTLTLQDSDEEVLVDFGNCYFQSARQVDPDEALKTRGALVEVKFVG